MRYAFWELFERTPEGRFQARFTFQLNGQEIQPHEAFEEHEDLAGLAVVDLLGCDLEGYEAEGQLLIYGYYRPVCRYYTASGRSEREMPTFGVPRASKQCETA